MVYYIRAKIYYKYASDLFKELIQSKVNFSEIQKKSQEIFKLGLKAIWSLSYVTPPEKTPEFKELWEKTLESLEPEDVPKVEKIKEILFSKEPDKKILIETVEDFLKIVKKVLDPIL